MSIWNSLLMNHTTGCFGKLVVSTVESDQNRLKPFSFSVCGSVWRSAVKYLPSVASFGLIYGFVTEEVNIINILFIFGPC